VTRRPGLRTGLGIVLSRADGDRAILTFSGAIGALAGQDVESGLLASARHVHVSSPFLQTALRPGLADLLRRAHAAGATTSLDPGWDPRGGWDLDDVFGELDLLLPNAEELRRLTDIEATGAAAAAIAARGPSVAVKLGAQGALLTTATGTMAVGPPRIDVVDTTGAGDSFAAGLIAGRLRGLVDTDALALAAAAGALAVRAAGGTGSQPDLEEASRVAAELSRPTVSDANDAPDGHTARELASQPETWERALTLSTGALPKRGARVLALGAGTSYYVLDSWARRRQELDGSPTRAHIASEFGEPVDVDAVVVLSRSGTSSDTLHALERVPHGVPRIGLIGVAESPIALACDRVVLLDFADERSVVQTRFATTALAFLRHALGEQLAPVVAQARAALADSLAVAGGDVEHLVFLGSGWSLGLAHEAALKCREAARVHSEAYAVGEYQHGPIAVAGPGSVVWSLVPVADALSAAITATGARLIVARRDPMAELVAVHRVAVAAARHRGLDPDAPAHLSRSVVLG
jgi:glutamine---fructose-6-phosphate transaminase (isomerizing)